MPPPITTTVALRGIRNISSPERQQEAGSASAAVTGSSPFGSGCTQSTGSAARSAKPPTRVALAHWLMRPFRAVQARAAPEARLAGDRAADETSVDAAADLAHHARVLVAHDHGRRPREEALGRVHVGAADARGGHVHHHLPRPRDGIGRLVEGEAGAAAPGRDLHGRAAAACFENCGITWVARSSIERRHSAGWSQSCPPIRSVPKGPVSSRRATSCSSTRSGAARDDEGALDHVLGHVLVGDRGGRASA